MDNQICVIIPVYNTEKYLRKCLDSVKNQTYKNLEVILVDDGSTDGCPDICDEYVQMDERFHVIHKENGGAAAARNAGLDYCVKRHKNGGYISFVDSDDYIDLDMYESMLSRILETGAKMCSCRICCEDENGKVFEIKNTAEVKKMSSKETWLSFSPLRKNTGSSPMNGGKLFEQSLFAERRFPLDLPCEDIFFANCNSKLQ